jgi:beta-galactosidase
MVKLLNKVHTAGKPYQIVLDADRKTITANGEDISFVTVSVVDKNGILCPTATNQLKFQVTRRVPERLNGDASLEMFHKDTMKLLAEVSSPRKIYYNCG